ncbi:ankyrin repeat domain-containing protein [Wolbachia endosymbiont of Oedothorax gibbosus]|uniref:ankyrin repeat domain-containing protein n=1 Tax=Wolbachia endosymbiont of Oedothorax gibbosus TaxID=931100 RepID=UPI0020250073|nr:ankyrin repeat domain-containing protein [Wolbachia endosymbiont of Oedothorax gibbosus]
MSAIFFYKEFNGHDLGKGESPLRKKFNTIIKDLKENKLTHQGNIKLISSKGGIKYLRAKLSDEGRLLFTNTKHNNKDVFVILEVIPNHDYENSRFLKSTDKTKSIEIKETEEGIIEKSSDNVHNVEIKDLERAHWLGKLVTFGATQEDIVKRAEECRLPLIISGAAGSGKTSVALESLKKIQEKFKGGKILYITKSKNLVKESKKLLEYEYYDETTNKYETRVPEEIEFLSVHEFIEKVTKEGAEMRKSVEGKKPINRNAFFSWFNTKCDEGKFRKYKKDGDKIFEELIAVIGGRGLLGKEGKVQYVDLGDRQSIFPKDERCSIYDFFEEYKKFIEGSSEYYDTSLIAYECIKEVQKVYDAVVVDEVQDLTSSTLNLILRSLKSESKGNFLLCGDVNQVVHPSFFSLSKLKSFLSQNEYVRNQGSEVFYTLEKNYRNSEQVIELANRILHLKNYCFASEDKMTADEAFFMKSDTENTGNVSFIADDKKEEIAKKVSQSINWAVLVLDDEKKEEARKLFSTPLVFNIHEAKGLEFENVILYKFMSCKAYNGIWNIVCPKKTKGEIDNAISEVRGSYEEVSVNTSRNKNKEDKSFEEYKFYMNALYVGASRAIDSVYIMDNEKKCHLLKVIKPEKIVSVDIKKEESTPEQWKNKALELIDKGNIEQAESIEKKLQDKGEKKYAEEIMNALKAQGYHSEQAISELKTEPQKSSTMVSNEKREQNPSKKKITEEELEENTNRLFLALDNGNLQLAEKLIKRGVDINAKDKNGLTLLHYAAARGYKDVAELLFKHEKIDVNVKIHGGFTPLHLAVQEGHEEIAELFLNHEKVDVNAMNNNGKTSLHAAAAIGHTKIVKLFLNHEKIDVNVQSENGATPLHMAAINGHTEVAKLLLECGAHVDSISKGGHTALYLAAVEGYENIVEPLLRYGAKVDAEDKEGTTPLHIAAQKGHDGVATLLLKHDAKVDAKNKKGATPLHVVAEYGCDSIVKLLLSCGADVNSGVQGGLTPLHIAAQNGRNGVVKFLLKHGADVNAMSKKGATPLHVVAEYGCDSVAKLLLKHGADVNAKTKEDWAPLHFAGGQGHYEVVALLLNNGADVNAKTKEDWAPLHFAGGQGHYEVVALLLNNGADVNAKTKEGFTTLHFAGGQGHYEVVALLLNNGADVNAKTKEGFTTLHFAGGQGHYEVVALLLNNGANVNSKIKKGFTTLHFAAQNGHKDVVKLFLADSSINVGHVKITDFTDGESKLKFLSKLQQDNALFNKVKEVKGGKDEDKLLKEIEDLLNKKNQLGFKPSLNYSPDGNDENTTIKIAIKAGGKLLQLLYDYAKENMEGTEIFKQLKIAKEHENTQPKSNVSVSGHLIQGFKLGGA